MIDRETDRAAFALELSTLAEIFAEPVSQARYAGYFEVLKDLDLAVVLSAIRAAARTLKFFPKPAELRELAEGSIDDLGAVAWTRLLLAIERVGTYQSVDFGDPILHAVIVQMGGWGEMWRLERIDERERGFKRMEFTRLYGAFSRRGLSGRTVGHLVGQAEGANALQATSWERGREHVDPVLRIGDHGQVLPEQMPALVSGDEAAKALEAASAEEARSADG